MIIDADVHISPVPQPGGSITIDQLLAQMDQAKVDQALTWLQPPYMRHLEESNRYVYQAAKAHPDRILPFGWADPNLGVQKAIDTVKQCVEEYGFLGVKLNGAQNNFYIDDEKLTMPVIEAIAATGKPAAFHIGCDAFEATHPFRLAKIARRFPQMTILMVHMGGVAFHDMSAAAIEFAAQCPNLHLIGSAIRPRPILRAIRALGVDRVSFGSDAPFELIHVELAKYRALLAGQISESELAQVLGGNIARVLGVPSGRAAVGK